jgi:hypothetical protein
VSSVDGDSGELNRVQPCCTACTALPALNRAQPCYI